MTCSASPFRLLTAAALLALAAPAAAQYRWSANFNDLQTPAGSHVWGNSFLSINRGKDNTPCLALTDSGEGLGGTFILPQIWAADESPGDITLRFDARLTGGTAVMGDGFSVSVMNGMPTALVDEEGVAPGPLFSFDTYENDVFEGGLRVAWPNGGNGHSGFNAPPNRISSFFPNKSNHYPVVIRMRMHGKMSTLTVDDDEKSDIGVLTSSSPVVYPDARIVFGARTGAARNAHLIDNITLKVTPYPIIREHPRSIAIVEGGTAEFSALSNFNTLPFYDVFTPITVASASSEWQVRHPGGDWIAVPGSQAPLAWSAASGPRVSFPDIRENRGLWDGDDPAASLDGTEVRCVLYWHTGYAVGSQPAVLRVLPDPRGNPEIITAFGAAPLGNASVEFPPNEGKVLRLTPAAPDQRGGFRLEETAGGPEGGVRLVDGFTAVCEFRLANSSPDPADGFSWNLAQDLPGGLPDSFLEEGIGAGLTVSVDTYENDITDPPGIELRYRGQLVSRALISPAGLVGNGGWRHLYVRVEPDGTADVALDGFAHIHNVALTGWSRMTAPYLGLYGRTGGFFSQQEVRNIAVLMAGGIPPFFMTNPALPSRDLLPGSIIVNVAAGGSGPLAFVWKKNGVVQPAAPNQPRAMVANGTGDYSVGVSNAFGSVTSNSARFVLTGDAGLVKGTGLNVQGGLLGTGAQDTRWTMTGPSGPAPARVPNTRPQTWPNYGAAAQWLSPSLDSAAAPGEYRFTTTFDMSGHDHLAARVSGTWAAETGRAVIFNGVTVQQQNVSADFPASFEITTGFLPGRNTLTFVVRVENVFPGPVGFWANLRAGARPIPRLAITPQGADVRLAWPAADNQAWRVSESADLKTWTPLPNVPGLAGGDSVLTLPRHPGSRWFRLFKTQ